MLNYILNPFVLINLLWMVALLISVNWICHWFGSWNE
jgi:hypothetical protein